jgi:hypothetical protein
MKESRRKSVHYGSNGKEKSNSQWISMGVRNIVLRLPVAILVEIGGES